MLLVIDAGNTSLHFGVFEEDRLVWTGRAPTPRDLVEVEVEEVLRPVLQQAGVLPRSLRGIAAASVVPALTPALRAAVQRLTGVSPSFVGEALRPALPVRYDPPAAVGVDRLLNASAAMALCGAPVLVVDFGTATKFDAVSAAGEFVGGAIAPGIAISLEGLAHAAPHLPRPGLARPERVVGGSTVECLQSGIYWGTIGQVEGMVRRFRAELGAETPVVATGGYAEVLQVDLQCVSRVEPCLTLEGLRILWEQSKR